MEFRLLGNGSNAGLFGELVVLALTNLRLLLIIGFHEFEPVSSLR